MDLRASIPALSSEFPDARICLAKVWVIVGEVLEMGRSDLFLALNDELD
jgi:hypothetical protein